MSRDEQERINNLDREWDAHQDGHSDDPLVDRLHASDTAPAPSRHFRQHLEDSLRNTHPFRSGAEETDQSQSTTDPEPTPITQAAKRSWDQDRAITRPSTLRQWGELAAIVVILSLAIAGSALYGDDAFDFAQQQIASDTDDAETVDDLRTALQEEGEVTGLTFEEAQELTPMEIANPSELPEGVSEPEFDVLGRAYVDRLDRSWPNWRATATFETGDDLPPIEIDFAPALGVTSLGTPLPTDTGRHQDAPPGNFNVIQIDGQNLLRSEELTDDGEIISHVRWLQGGVEIRFAAPAATDLSDEQQEWIDMPETPFSYQDIESMIGSLLEHGDLHDGSEHIATQNVSLAEALEWRPTAPFSETLPEPLEPLSASAHPNGPALFMSHPDEAMQEIWLHSFVGIGVTRPGASAHEELMEVTSSELLDVDGVPVSRFAFTDPQDPEVVEFLLASRTMEPVLPWISGDNDSTLIAYLWDIAGMSFFMGVEVDPDFAEFTDSGEIAISDELPEDDWLELISDQQRVAEETLDPEELFPMFAGEATEEEQAMVADVESGDHPQKLTRVDEVRFIRQVGDVRYFIGRHGNDGICVLTTIIRDGEETLASGGCNALFAAAELGAGISSHGRDQPSFFGQVLPQGYDEVVDENGDLVAEVEDQLFALTLESGEEHPSAMIAHGPAGELYLGLGTSGRSERDTSLGLEAP